MANEQFDVTVIGSGPGGYVAAIRAGQLGLKVAIVEKDKRLGGTCTLRGCIPTKQLLMSAHVYEQMQHAADFGVQASEIQLAFADVQKRKDKVVMKNSKGIEFLMKKNKCTVFKGSGKLILPGKVEVTDGPFVETKEHVAGFWIVEAADLDVALQLAAAGSKACNRKVEVRPFHGPR